MEEAFRAGGVLEKAPVKAPKDSSAPQVKREDLDLIVCATCDIFSVEELDEVDRFTSLRFLARKQKKC